ncbi:uncharacterized protein LOC143580526 [Bidens hawaiensis]|uniref:uncharacterized protein LOC143580526 n=1 Tax=Bidens hawaiensis TaxID=980011 RepID=UPI00404929FA
MDTKKRPFEDTIESNSANSKKVRSVAEMVLVLSAMGKMRAGGKPTAVEVNMMTKARGELAGICNEFAPKDVFPRDAFRMLIEDLGFNGKLGHNMSIAHRLQLTKEKMEKSEVFPIHSATSTPPDSSRSFQNNSSAAHASPISNSRTLPYQLPTSEVRPVGSTVLTSSKANSVADHKPSHAPSRSTQSQSVSSNNNTGLLNVTNINHHKQHQMNLAVNTHNEIAKIVQKVLHTHAPGQRTWTPPSRDYMNKPLTCQTCKSMINEVDNVIICDACEKGYHLRCLQCNPKSVFGDECREWHCDKCLAISNGKPLPLKYGRVMRNVNMPKRSASSAGGQPCLDKTVASSDENCNQRLMSANGQDMDVCSKTVTQNGDNGKNEEVTDRGE